MVKGGVGGWGSEGQEGCGMSLPYRCLAYTMEDKRDSLVEVMIGGFRTTCVLSVHRLSCLSDSAALQRYSCNVAPKRTVALSTFD